MRSTPTRPRRWATLARWSPGASGPWPPRSRRPGRGLRGSRPGRCSTWPATRAGPWSKGFRSTGSPGCVSPRPPGHCATTLRGRMVLQTLQEMRGCMSKCTGARDFKMWAVFAYFCLNLTLKLSLVDGVNQLEISIIRLCWSLPRCWKSFYTSYLLHGTHFPLKKTIKKRKYTKNSLPRKK